MLRGALAAGYSFVSFSILRQDAGGDPFRPKGNLCLLRHDVDADVFAAGIMAELESEMGISSTFFLMLRSPLYNLMSRCNHRIIEKILDLGHEIGLHYDQGFDEERGLDPSTSSACIMSEAEWLERQFSTTVSAVSFHQPGLAVLEGHVDTLSLVNTYDRERLAGIEYYSDSNRQFALAGTASCPEQIMAAKSPQDMQLLIHPMWWVYDDPTTEAVWNRTLRSNCELAERQLLETERAFGRARVYNIATP